MVVLRVQLPMEQPQGWDMSGNGSSGTASNANGAGMSWTDGKFGGATSFDGVDDYVSTGVNGMPSGASARTIETWMNYTGNGGVIASINAASGQKFIFSIGNVGGAWYLFTDGVNVNNNIVLTGAEIPTAGAWHHVVITLDAANNWKYYLDGGSGGNPTKSGTFATAISTNTPTFIYDWPALRRCGV